MQNSLFYKRIKVVSAFMALLLATVALANSSFAWLAISRTPIVSNLELAVMTDSDLEIALDENGRPGDWDVVLDLSSYFEDVVPLRPVTFSKNNNSMYTYLFGVDGRTTAFTMPLSDAENANVKGIGDPVAESNGYYLTCTFWMRGPQSGDVRLATARAIKEGLAGSGTYVIGKPVWDGNAIGHVNGGGGLESAVRIGFLCTTTDLDGNPIEDSRFVLYEPNCNTHADGGTEYVETDSMDGGPLVDTNLIRQTASLWEETTPVLKDNVIYTMGEFMDDPFLFKMRSNTMEKVTMYVWVEIRDEDCVNSVMATQTEILGCLQFTTDGGYPDTGIGRD